jgi:RHS repeat-associated protein
LVPSPGPDLEIVFWFAGRPVATLFVTLDIEEWRLLTVDHLGTPALSTMLSGAVRWQGGFEPFGRDWQEDTPQNAADGEVFLRLPGQWVDGAWAEASLGTQLYYNAFRWYESGTGRYTRPDPKGLDAIRRFELADLPPAHLYAFTDGNPINRIDPLGTSWYDWIPGVKYIKCVYYTSKCRQDMLCCMRETGLGDRSADEERMAELIQRYGGRWSPQWIECFQKQPNCQKWIKYCGMSAQTRVPGTGRDPGSGPPILLPDPGGPGLPWGGRL